MRLTAGLAGLVSGLIVLLAAQMPCCGWEELTGGQEGSAGKSPASAEAQPEILDLLLKNTPQPDYGRPVPARVSGRVVLHQKDSTTGARGVSVTDGFSVVKTDAQGAYTLSPDPRAVFVYVTRPSGYDVRGDWYKPVGAVVDFSVQPATSDENQYVFVHVTDTHTSSNRRSLAGLSRFVNEVNALSPKPRFVINSGDLLNLHKALTSSPAEGRTGFRNYVGIMNHLRMPCYNVAGDHTDSAYRLEEFPRGHIHCGKPLYWEYLGPHFFSFEYGRIHFMSVDFGYHLGRRQLEVNGKRLEYPSLEVQPEHVRWMKQDMAGRMPGAFVVTTAEQDLTKYCPGFPDMARQHDVRLQLVGDSHVVSYKERPVPYRSGGALAGCWWNPRAGQLCPDLSPQGYLIYSVKGEKLESFYKGLGRRVEIVSPRLGAPWQDRVQFKAHLVQPRPGEALEYSVNGKPWQTMRRIGRPFYRALHAATVDSTSLPDGLVKVAVRSTGSGELRSREFVVVNGRLPSQYETSATLSFHVGPATSWTTSRAPAAKVDVLFNGQAIGSLEPGIRKQYSFTVPASLLRVANRISFRYSQHNDGFNLSSPLLTFREMTIHDPRDEAIRRVRVAHWGKDAADWGGFIAGAAEPPDETPFHRRQNVFCFLLPHAD